MFEEEQGNQCGWGGVSQGGGWSEWLGDNQFRFLHVC